MMMYMYTQMSFSPLRSSDDDDTVRSIFHPLQYEVKDFVRVIDTDDMLCPKEEWGDRWLRLVKDEEEEEHRAAEREEGETEVRGE